MALPLNSTPIYSLTIPTTGKEIKFRPFLVKEERALLLAQQSEDKSIMMNTLKDIIKSCVKGNINVDELATVDIEYIFIQLRARSVGENVDLIFRCTHCDDKNAKVKITIDLTQLEVSSADNNKKIALFDNVGVVMKYPNMDTISDISDNSVDDILSVIIDCIDYIYDDREIYYASDTSREELLEFINNLSSEQFIKLQNFFENIPSIKKDVDYICPVCGKDNHVVLSGISSFF